MQTLPAWAPKPHEGEYIGVSFPDNGEEQAISLALFSYVLRHTVKGYFGISVSGRKYNLHPLEYS